MGFVPQTPDAPQANPFATAATALVQGLMVGKAEVARQQEATRNFAIQEAQLQEQTRQFDQRHQLAIKEADNLVSYQRDALNLQERNLDLDRERWVTDKAAIEMDMTKESFLLGEQRRISQKSIESDQTLKALFDDIAVRRGADNVGVTVFSHLVDESGKIIARDPMDSGTGAWGNKTYTEAGVSVNQESVQAAFPGLSKDEQRKIQVEVFKDGESLGMLPVVDRGPHKRILKREGRQVLDFTPLGIRKLGGDVIVKDGLIKGHTLQGSVSFQLHGPNGETTGRFFEEDVPVGPGFLPPESVGGEPTLPTLSEEIDGSLFPSAVPAEGTSPLYQQYEQLKNGLSNPRINEDGQQQIKQTIETLTTDPEVRAAVNEEDAKDYADVNAMPETIRDQFVAQAKKSRVRMGPDQLDRLYEGMAAQVKAASKTTEFAEMPEARQKEDREYAGAWNLIQQVGELWDNVDDSETGRIQGLISKAVNAVFEKKDYALAQGFIDSAVPGIAKGLFGDSGVLSNQDIQRALSGLPKGTNSKELNRAFVENIEELLIARMSTGISQDRFLKRDWQASAGFLESQGVPVDRLLNPELMKAKKLETRYTQLIQNLESGKGEELGGFTFRKAGESFQVIKNGQPILTRSSAPELMAAFREQISK